MAILKIARMGHPLLARPALPVTDAADPSVQRLIDDMVETMDDADGAGLAAPQVFVPLRVVVFRVAGFRNDGDEVALTVLINPEVEALDEGRESAYEGCLSLPGLTGRVPRFTSIRYRALGRAGEPIERVAHGFHARVVQHECDHLDGILYPMRMPDLTAFGFVEEVRRAMTDPA